MINPANKISSHGIPVNSNNNADMGSDYYFNRLICDTMVAMNNDIRNKIKRPKWYYLPTQEHLEELLKKYDKELEHIDCGDYIKVRLK